MDNNLPIIGTGETRSDTLLPPLPASDPESIAQNKFSGFYNVGAREYWKHAEITLNKVQDFTPCPHYFSQEGSEVHCRRCHAGFTGQGIRAQNGKLFINNIETQFE